MSVAEPIVWCSNACVQGLLMCASSLACVSAACDMLCSDKCSLVSVCQEIEFSGKTVSAALLRPAERHHDVLRCAVLQWVEYFEAPDRSSRQLFNVLSLSLAGTPLEDQVRQWVVGWCQGGWG
jgi:hypothetical protein